MGISAPGIEIEDIRSEEALEDIKPEWEFLYDSSTATPFQSPEWVLPWWRHFGGGRLWAIAVRECGSLAGLAPLFIFTNEKGKRQVSFIGSGISDYLDVLTHQGEREAAQTIFEHIMSKKDEWDVCDFQELRETSQLLNVEGLKDSARVEDQSICMHLELPCSVEEFLRGFSRHRKSLRASFGALEKKGRLEMERASEGDLEEFLGTLFALHQARWRLSGEDGVLADERIQSFHREAAAGMLRKGSLRFYRMRLDGKDIAAHYGFKKDRRFYCYLGGYDPEFEKFSPGKLLLAEAIYEAIGEGDVEFDFLRGSEEYKYVWRPKVSMNRRIIISKGNPL